jgi:hypothetical protein
MAAHRALTARPSPQSERHADAVRTATLDADAREGTDFR